MAIPSEPKLRRYSHSDYGSDFDTDGEALISNLLTEFEASTTESLVLESIEDVTGTPSTSSLHIPKIRSSVAVQEDKLEVYLRRRALRSASVEVEYNEHSRGSWSGNYKSIPQAYLHLNIGY
jgi:exonuclease V